MRKELEPSIFYSCKNSSFSAMKSPISIFIQVLGMMLTLLFLFLFLLFAENNLFSDCSIIYY